MSTVTFSTNMTYPQNTFPRKRFPTFFRLLAPRQLRVPTKLSACSLLQRGASETQSRTTPPGNPHIPIRRESPGSHSQAKVTADPRCTTIVSRNSMISGRIPGLRIPAIHRRPPQGPRGYQGISRVVMREVPTYLVGTEVHAHRQRVVDALQLFASKAEQFELSHSEGESIPDVLLERWEEVYLQNDPRFESGFSEGELHDLNCFYDFLLGRIELFPTRRLKALMTDVYWDSVCRFASDILGTLQRNEEAEA